MQDLTLPSVEIIDGQPMTTSLAVAEHFEKLHRDVLRAIRELEDSLKSSESQRSWYLRNFAQIQFTTDLGEGRTRKDPAYLMTKDGFALLAMGFTGERALRFKINYINAFNTLAETVKVQQAEMLRLQHENNLLTRLVQGSEPAELALKVQQYAIQTLGAPLYPTAPDGLLKRKQAAQEAGMSGKQFYAAAKLLGMRTSPPDAMAHLTNPGQWIYEDGAWHYGFSKSEIEFIRRCADCCVVEGNEQSAQGGAE